MQLSSSCPPYPGPSPYPGPVRKGRAQQLHIWLLPAPGGTSLTWRIWHAAARLTWRLKGLQLAHAWTLTAACCQGCPSSSCVNGVWLRHHCHGHHGSGVAVGHTHWCHVYCRRSKGRVSGPAAAHTRAEQAVLVPAGTCCMSLPPPALLTLVCSPLLPPYCLAAVPPPGHEGGGD